MGLLLTICQLFIDSQYNNLLDLFIKLGVWGILYKIKQLPSREQCVNNLQPLFTLRNSAMCHFEAGIFPLILSMIVELLVGYSLVHYGC